ncbi:GNAT family N-acetyltransferase [Pseudomonas asplenii]|uniref:GNAT family N-acetyltransferase n=1 Tax=Pseudomonas asplenii TaxID=53407 RepID=UPI00036F0790|nr:GNAT family N-acetyltransferase [Pseudomonas fuscovaginae]
MPTETPAILIERFREAHVDGITALYNEPAVCRQVLQMPFQSAEVWRQRLLQRQGNERLVSLVAVHDGVVIGSCSLEQYERVRRSHAGNVGMGVATAWQGKGVGSRLLAAVLEVADNWMNLQRVELSVYVDNQAARALYRKFGFEEEGVMRAYAIRDGVLTDALSMARLRQL